MSEIAKLKDLTVKLKALIGKQTAKISRLKEKNAEKVKELAQKRVKFFEPQINYLNSSAAHYLYKFFGFLMLLTIIYGTDLQSQLAMSEK